MQVRLYITVNVPDGEGYKVQEAYGDAKRLVDDAVKVWQDGSYSRFSATETPLRTPDGEKVGNFSIHFKAAGGDSEPV